MAMQEVNRFRGPDASQVFEEKQINWQIGLGVNRLQVIDKDAGSNQPMISGCGNFILVYNGEVYNYRELKNQLIGKGHEFKTNSDTEVVLLWLKEYGTGGISSFKGMFALVFIDLTAKRLIVARDRQGIKPLFYYKSANTLIISSSVQAIEATQLVKLKINNKAIGDYLSYRHVMDSNTFYQEVYAQEPGIISVYAADLSVTESILELPYNEDDKDLKTILTETASLFMEAETAPGLMLSGGVDSTLLLAILRNELDVGINTYTLASGNDQKWAKMASAQYNSRHLEIQVTIDSLQQVDSFLKQTDQPIGDHGAFATWLVAEAASKNSNTLLSGAGADELFAGYNRHRAYNYYLKNQSQALLFKKLSQTLGFINSMPKTANQFLRGIEVNPILTYQNFLQNHGIKKSISSDNLWPAPKSLRDNMAEALKFDQSQYLVADVLAITDNSIMQHGIEARVPYLYDDVLSYANSISVQDKCKMKGKGPLKKILIDYGGLKYTRRTKQGFGLPMAAWLQDKQSFWLWEFLSNDSPIFEYVQQVEINKLLRLHQEGKKDNSMQLWSILVLENWLTRFYK